MHRDDEKALPGETEAEARESAARALKRAEDQQQSDEEITRFAEARRQLISEKEIDSHLQRVIEPKFDRR